MMAMAVLLPSCKLEKSLMDIRSAGLGGGLDPNMVYKTRGLFLQAVGTIGLHHYYNYY